jgi:hypothetical protein
VVHYSPHPWTAERIARGFVHVLSHPNGNGARDLVALVDGGAALEANTALILSAPVVAAAVLAGDLAAARAALLTGGIA